MCDGEFREVQRTKEAGFLGRIRVNARRQTVVMFRAYRNKSNIELF